MTEHEFTTQTAECADRGEVPAPLHLEGATRDFGSRRALDGVTIRIPPGRIVALLGPNGAGKTTLIRLLVGMLEPTAGRVRILGEDPRYPPPAWHPRVACMIDGHEPPRWARLRDLLRLQAGASLGFDRPRAEYLLDQQGLEFHRRYGTLSRGQKRWSLAVLALAAGAELLLLDEPADGLDPAARRRLYDLLREQATARNVTILVATHVLGDIERVADDVAMLAAGRLSLHASLEDIREHVREVELPDTRAVPPLPPGYRLLGRRLADTTLLAWVICDLENDSDLHRLADGCAVVRPCSLEDVYLALSEYSLDYVDIRKAAK